MFLNLNVLLCDWLIFLDKIIKFLHIGQVFWQKCFLFLLLSIWIVKSVFFVKNFWFPDVGGFTHIGMSGVWFDNFWIISDGTIYVKYTETARQKIKLNN